MSTAWGAWSWPEKTRYASLTAIASTPSFSSRSGAAPASSRPTVMAEPAIRTVSATWPARVSGAAHVSASSGAASTASHGRAPRAAHPSASAQPGGTSSSATHVSTSAVVGTSAIATTTTAMFSGRTSAHAPVRYRFVHAGSPAAGSATHAHWATVSATLSQENHTALRLEQHGPHAARDRQPPRAVRGRRHVAAVEEERGERAGVGLRQGPDSQRALVAVAALGDRDRHGRVDVEGKLVVRGGHDYRMVRGA